MSDPANTSFPLVQTLISTIPILVGGFLTAFGVFGGSILNHFLKKSSDRILLKRDKIEQVVTCSYDVLHWLERKEKEYLFSGDEVDVDDSLSKLEMLIILYFPDLYIDFNEFKVSVLNCRKWLVETAKKKLVNPKHEIDVKEKFPELYKDILKCQSGLCDKAATIMKNLKS